MRTHSQSLYACDFFSVETLGFGGLQRHMVFFVMEVRTRVLKIAGIRVDPVLKSVSAVLQTGGLAI